MVKHKKIKIMKNVNVKNWISELNKKIEDLKTRIESDYVYAYEWGIMDDLYKEKFKKQTLELALKSTELEISEGFLKESLQGLLLNLEFKSSSIPADSRSQVLRAESLKEMLRDLNWFIIF